MSVRVAVLWRTAPAQQLLEFRFDALCRVLARAREQTGPPELVLHSHRCPD